MFPLFITVELWRIRLFGICGIYRNFDINLPDSDGKEIRRDWYKTDPQRYIRSLRKLNGIQASLNDSGSGPCLFSISRGIITHAGIMINDKEFAHMSPKGNFRISKWKDIGSQDAEERLGL